MLYPLFLLGGAWFYGLFVLETIILIWCLEKEEPAFANGAMILFFVFLWLLGDFNVFVWVKNNPGTLAQNGIAYVVIGLIYAVIKYTFYLTDKKRKYDRTLQEYLEKVGKSSIEKLTNNERQNCHSKLNRVYLPTFTDSTKSIIFWMMYWPWSAAWTLLNNPLKWLYEELYDRMAGLFKRIYEKIIGERKRQLKELESGNG